MAVVSLLGAKIMIRSSERLTCGLGHGVIYYRYEFYNNICSFDINNIPPLDQKSINISEKMFSRKKRNSDSKER